jgi:outer membrane protein TolC
VPLFKEFALRGEAQVAQAQLDTAQAQLSDKNAQVDADVRDALLDIASAQKQVEVANPASPWPTRRSARRSSATPTASATTWPSARPSSPWPRPTINT